MKTIAIIMMALALVGAGTAFGATAGERFFYPRQGDTVTWDDLDLECHEQYAMTIQGKHYAQTLVCDDASSGDGPHVVVGPTTIVVSNTPETRTLFKVKRDR
jgi:hypothetical protein